MRKAWLRVAGGLLLLGAVVLVALAFTRFDDGPAPQPGSPAFAEFRAEQVRDARISTVLGLAGAVALVGGFGCLQAARAAEPPSPQS